MVEASTRGPSLPTERVTHPLSQDQVSEPIPDQAGPKDGLLLMCEVSPKGDKQYPESKG